MRYDREYPDERDEAAAMEPPGHPSAWLWLVYLFFRPGAFFRTFAKRPAPVLTAGCAWLLSMVLVIGVQFSLDADSRSAPLPESWGAFWGLGVVLGAVFGVMVYFLGGAVYRIWLHRCTVSVPDSGLATRVLFSRRS